MSRLRSVTICFTDLLDEAKKGHSAFFKSDKSGKVYARVSIWDNEEPDKFDNNVSMQLSPTQEKEGVDKKIYVGNGKIVEFKPQLTTNSADKPIIAANEGDDLPF